MASRVVGKSALYLMHQIQTLEPQGEILALFGCKVRDQVFRLMQIGQCETNFIKAVGKGLYKIMSKMGISTFQSYCGAQIFEAIGLNSKFIEKYFTGTTTNIEGIGLA